MLDTFKYQLFLISSYDFDSVVLFLTGFKSLLTFSNALLLSSYKVLVSLDLPS